MHRSSSKKLISKLRNGNRPTNIRIKLSAKRHGAERLESSKSSAPRPGLPAKRPLAGGSSKPEPRFLSDAALANAEQLLGSIKSQSGADLGEKIKDLIRAVASRPPDDALVAETARRIAEIRVSAEGKEGIASFLEKRKPSWCSRKS